MRRCELGRSVLFPSATDLPSTKVSRRAIQPACRHGRGRDRDQDDPVREHVPRLRELATAEVRVHSDLRTARDA